MEDLSSRRGDRNRYPNDARTDMKTLDSLADAMCTSLPQVVANSCSENELFRLKLWYYDTHAPEYYFLAEPMRSVYRDQLLKKSDVGEWPLSKIWDEPDPVLREFIVNDKAIASANLFTRVNDWRTSDNTDVDTTAILHGFACRICRLLNEIDWGNYLQVDPDFVVYAQNGTDYGVDNYEDLIECIPSETVSRLRTRKLLGPGKMYTDHPDYSTNERWEMVMYNAGIDLHPKDDWKVRT